MCALLQPLAQLGPKPHADSIGPNVSLNPQTMQLSRFASKLDKPRSARRDHVHDEASFAREQGHRIEHGGIALSTQQPQDS